MNKTALREQISTYFSLSEIRTLMFDLGISYDEFTGGKSDRVMQLIDYMIDEPERDLNELVVLCEEQRDFLNWR